jgi:hypothetical protein
MDAPAPPHLASITAKASTPSTASDFFDNIPMLIFSWRMGSARHGIGTPSPQNMDMYYWSELRCGFGSVEDPPGITLADLYEWDSLRAG